MKSGKALDKALKRENRVLKGELREKTRELSFFIDSGKALTSTLDFKEVLKIIVDKARQIIHCEAWSLLLVDENDQDLYFELVKGRRTTGLKGLRLKMGEGIAGWVAEHGVPLLVPDARKDPRFLNTIDQMLGFKTRSILCVPLISKKRTVGILEMMNRKGGAPFEKKDMDLLLTLVDQAAIAIERAQLYQKVADQAITDDLTKLYNFRFLDRSLDVEINRCKRYGMTFGVIFLDMDFFKHVNDTHGHLIGSQVLIEVAQILKKNLRDVDILARYGGDEFISLLPETKVSATHEVAQRLRKAVKEHLFLKDQGLTVRLTASFGVSCYPAHARNKVDLIRMADQAMYRAKMGGRDMICVAERGKTIPLTARRLVDYA